MKKEKKLTQVNTMKLLTFLTMSRECRIYMDPLKE